jgi:hypothetical protein
LLAEVGAMVDLLLLLHEAKTNMIKAEKSRSFFIQVIFFSENKHFNVVVRKLRE